VEARSHITLDTRHPLVGSTFEPIAAGSGSDASASNPTVHAMVLAPSARQLFWASGNRIWAVDDEGTQQPRAVADLSSDRSGSWPNGILALVDTGKTLCRPTE